MANNKIMRVVHTLKFYTHYNNVIIQYTLRPIRYDEGGIMGV